jgi:acyl-CoA thioester hydrolase
MREFSMRTRVYIEDTDAGGVVFYANYLRYMERARTEALRACGIALSDLQDHQRRLFVVRSIEVDYLAPARLDDELTVFSNMIAIKRASLFCEQPIMRGDQRLVDAKVGLVCINADTGRPVGIPEDVSDAVHAYNDSRP